MSRRFTQVLRNDSLHLVDFWEGQSPRGIGIRKEGEYQLLNKQITNDRLRIKRRGSYMIIANEE